MYGYVHRQMMTEISVMYGSKRKGTWLSYKKVTDIHVTLWFPHDCLHKGQQWIIESLLHHHSLKHSAPRHGILHKFCWVIASSDVMFSIQSSDSGKNETTVWLKTAAAARRQTAVTASLKPSLWLWKGVSATLQCGRYTLSYPGDEK